MSRLDFTANTKYLIIRDAISIGNVSETCKKFGISRTLFYQWYNRYKALGVEGLQPQKRVVNNKRQVSCEVEYYILEHVINCPEDGPRRIYYELKTQGFSVGESGIYNVLKRYQLNSKNNRLKYAKEHNTVSKSGKKKEFIININSMRNKSPGYAVFQITNFLGDVRNIGKIYAIISFDLFSHYIIGSVCVGKNTENLISHMKMKVIPTFQSYGVSIARLITDSSMQYTSNWHNGKHKYAEFLNKYKISQLFFSTHTKNVINVMNEHLLPIRNDFFQKFLSIRYYKTAQEIDSDFQEYLIQYNNQEKRKIGKLKGKTPANILYESNDDKPLPLWVYLQDLESDKL